MTSPAERQQQLDKIAAWRDRQKREREDRLAAIEAEAEAYARRAGLPEDALSPVPTTTELVLNDLRTGGDGTAGLRLAMAQARRLVRHVNPRELAAEKARLNAAYQRDHKGPIPEGKLPPPKPPQRLIRRSSLCPRCASKLEEGHCPDCGFV